MNPGFSDSRADILKYCSIRDISDDTHAVRRGKLRERDLKRERERN